MQESREQIIRLNEIKVFECQIRIRLLNFKIFISVASMDNYERLQEIGKGKLRLSAKE